MPLLLPVAGTLITRNVEPGDVVQPGKVLMVLSPTSVVGDTQLVVQIDEKNLRLLKLGQTALARQQLQAFMRVWPQADQLPFVAPRLRLLRQALEAGEKRLAG